MNHAEARPVLADLIAKLGAATVCCWWKLTGDEPNSPCQLLDVSWAKLRLTLRHCHVLHGAADSFRTSVFEGFMQEHSDRDCSIDRPRCTAPKATGLLSCL